MKCIAYVRQGRDGNAWASCARRSVTGSEFCRTHRDAAIGVILGLWVQGHWERPGKESPSRPRPTAAGVPLEPSVKSIQ